MSTYADYPEVTPTYDKQAAPYTNSGLYPNPARKEQTSYVTSYGQYTDLQSPSRSSQSNDHGHGLSNGILMTIIGLIILLIGAAVGGGVGGSLAVKSCNDKLSSALRTSSTSVIPSSTTGGSASIATPIPNTGCQTGVGFSSTYTSISGAKFNKMCAHGIVGYDIVGVVVSSWDLCMEACANFNSYNSTNGQQKCLAVAFVPSWVNQAFATGNISIWTNCGLKYHVPTLPTLNQTQAWESVVSVLTT